MSNTSPDCSNVSSATAAADAKQQTVTRFVLGNHKVASGCNEGNTFKLYHWPGGNKGVI